MRADDCAVRAELPAIVHPLILAAVSFTGATRQPRLLLDSNRRVRDRALRHDVTDPQLMIRHAGPHETSAFAGILSVPEQHQERGIGYGT